MTVMALGEFVRAGTVARRVRIAWTDFSGFVLVAGALFALTALSDCGSTRRIEEGHVQDVVRALRTPAGGSAHLEQRQRERLDDARISRRRGRRRVRAVGDDAKCDREALSDPRAPS